MSGYIFSEYAEAVENSQCASSSGIKPLLYLRNELIKRNIYYNNPQNIIVIIKRLNKRSIINYNEFKDIL